MKPRQKQPLARLTFDLACHVGSYQNKQVLLCISQSQHL